MTTPTTRLPAAAASYDDLVDRVLGGDFGRTRAQRVAVAFSTRQAVRHESRSGGYRNEVLSLRLAAAVGSCAVEPGELPDAAIEDCVGADLARLMAHELRPVRVAALDTYLMHVLPHTPANGARSWSLPAGSSLRKSRQGTGRRRTGRCRAGRPGPRGRRGQLAAGGAPCARAVVCALRPQGGTTEWGEPVRTDALAELAHCDAVLASGMTLGNGSFEPLREHALRHGKPLVMFAQTGSAVLPRFLGSGVSAVCAEPYPFFWLDGGPGTVHRYRADASGAAR